jgi:hypothetical protein
MPIATTGEKNSLATKYGTDAPYAALFSTAPSGSTPGTEVTGTGYARQAISWGAASNGAITASVTFNVPSGQTVAGAGVYSAVTGGTYLDGGSLTSQAFASAGTYTLTLTYTQS